MHPSLALTTLLMGLIGGPHCVAMCGAACAGIDKNSGSTHAMWQFHAGRLCGYAALGALAAASVQGLAWFTSQTAALRPVWTFFHVLVLCWGLVLVAYARQPLWVDGMGRSVWTQMRQLSRVRGGVFLTGGLWAFMPCGLLYSAVLVAALGGSPAGGALSMATFALGTSVSLMVGPWLWLKLQHGNQELSMRIAGVLLSMAAAWAIWMDLTHPSQIWCAS
jgi:sulfite exporter TauE/SafE